MTDIPIYFPMTHLSETTEQMLSACFGRTVILRPSDSPLPVSMQAAADKGRLVVRTPVETGSGRLHRLLGEYYAWAEMNRGADLTAFQRQADGIPFFSDTSVSKIRQDIRGMKDDREEATQEDSVFKARLFLEMAQKLDHENNLLERSLDDLQLKESRMLEALLGQETAGQGFGPTNRPGSPQDPGAHRTAGRIQSWWQLAKEDAQSCDLLVTDSREVIAYLIENGSGLHPAAPAACVPLSPASAKVRAAWQAQFLTWLRQLVSEPAADVEAPALPAAEPGEASVTVYLSETGNAKAVFESLGRPSAGRFTGQTGNTLAVCLVVGAGESPPGQRLGMPGNDAIKY